jgi:hypothetical protein
MPFFSRKTGFFGASFSEFFPHAVAGRKDVRGDERTKLE